MSTDLPIERLLLPARIYNALVKAGIDSVDQLCAMDEGEVLLIPRMGKRALTQIRKALKKQGLSLR